MSPLLSPMNNNPIQSILSSSLSTHVNVPLGCMELKGAFTLKASKGESEIFLGPLPENQSESFAFALV